MHFWEEPCISGQKGSGAVFFSGCSMGCVFCQNRDIALGSVGKDLSISQLADIYLKLQEDGAHNINLVTPTHFIPSIVASLELAKSKGLTIPIVYNTGSLETVEALHMLDGLIDVYLPDAKYYDSAVAKRYARIPNYYQIAKKAIAEMVRQVGSPVFADAKTGSVLNATTTDELIEFSETGLIKKGVIIRHLLLPGQLQDSKCILKDLYETFGNRVFFSIMSQYTPVNPPEDYPELKRRVTEEEYEALLDFAVSLNIEQAFIQDREVADESFIPAFDYTGLF
jgi:putative pyruvate formate lyase activating enzyme